MRILVLRDGNRILIWIITNSKYLKSKLGLTAILNSFKWFVSCLRDAFSYFYSWNFDMHLLEEKIKRVFIQLKKSDNKIFHELKIISSYLWLVHLLLSNFLNFSDVVNYFQFQKGNEENKLFTFVSFTSFNHIGSQMCFYRI